MVEHKVTLVEADSISMGITDKKEYEIVNHPTHYNDQVPGLECKDVIQHFNFNRGTAIKHIWRCGSKPGSNPVDDLQKAIQYLEFEIDRIRAYE